MSFLNAMELCVALKDSTHRTPECVFKKNLSWGICYRVTENINSQILIEAPESNGKSDIAFMSPQSSWTSSQPRHRQTFHDPPIDTNPRYSVYVGNM